ncbi:MAG: hypothetical protein K1X89_09390 [Myxococcaceae bacterium]|nr:hypothetical protein [Myxococcaceae bacterium]
MGSFFSQMFRAVPEGSGDVVDRVAGMVGDRRAQALARRHGLQVLDLTWEDTARFKGSAVGPNISDLTLQVQSDRGARLMPVIRFPNFSDRTGDVAVSELFLRVGNERGGSLRRLGLGEYLNDLRSHLSVPGSWAGEERSLLAPRDAQVLVSAQACFLPVPRAGVARFNPVLFNYQSSPGAPAVLAILATREGTSATIIDNGAEWGSGTGWGQRLFFNQAGQRASFTGERLSDFTARGGDEHDGASSVEEAKGRGLNQVLLIQVPLELPRRERAFDGGTGSYACAAPMAAKCARPRGAGVEQAVIGHGELEGPFRELGHLPIRRDARFPIRVTVQFYQATDSAQVTEAEMAGFAERIEAVYRDARCVGSLVVDGDTGRSTEYSGASKVEPPGFWEEFWSRQERATGRSRLDLLRQLERMLGRRPGAQELDEALRRLFG